MHLTLRQGDVRATGRPHKARLFDFRNLALCDHRPWPTIDRRVGLVCEERRRHLHLGVPEFGRLPFDLVFLFPTMEPPVSYSLSPKLLMPYSVYAFAVSS